jgi:hypothetical protein
MAARAWAKLRALPGSLVGLTPLVLGLVVALDLPLRDLM